LGDSFVKLSGDVVTVPFAEQHFLPKPHGFFWVVLAETRYIHNFFYSIKKSSSNVAAM